MDAAADVNDRSTTEKIFGLVGWLAVTLLAAAAGAAASVDAGAFYAELLLPGWAPPAWLFGPVWTVLYTLMGIAAWLVWLEAGYRWIRGPLALFLVHLVPNALWSWLFFSWRLGAAAFADILLLLVLVGALAVTFWRVRPVAGGLLIPYALWVGFAAVLNLAVWQLNPLLLG